MDSSEYPVTRSPRKELQGPRPPTLKVRKDSHKIRKPPIATNPNPNQIPNKILQPPRAPVIIYIVSSKVIHTNLDYFMTHLGTTRGRCLWRRGTRRLRRRGR
ncbi:hypothetical protein LINPERHAP2_LOCUS14282 [Linum perenne]